jgi:hypothetical protein
LDNKSGLGCQRNPNQVNKSDFFDNQLDLGSLLLSIPSPNIFFILIQFNAWFLNWRRFCLIIRIYFFKNVIFEMIYCTGVPIIGQS